MPSSPFTYLITGANRGLGFEYAKALLASSPSVRIVAGTRNPSTSDDLQALASAKENEARVHIIKLDVTDPESVKEAVKVLENSGFLDKEGGAGIDSLVLSAGVANHYGLPSETTPAQVQSNLEVNLYGNLRMVEAFLSLVRKSKGKQIIAVSSTAGSIGVHGEMTDMTSYAISKTALNMYMRKLSRELEPEGFTVVMVRTGMNLVSGEQLGQYEPAEAAQLAVENVFLKITRADNGLYTSLDGSGRPW
ncbi:hypothetical protein JCM8547_008903 [Rhodosporidiobolus lusitaniae]